VFMKITNLQRWQEGRGLISLRYKSIAILLIVSFVTILSEALGLSFFYPIFQYIQADGDISILLESSKIWVAVIEATDKLDINISLGLLLSLAFVFFLGRQIFTYIKMVYATKIQASLLKNLRSKLFDSYLNASAEYHDTYSVGSLTNIMTQEANAAVLGILKPIELIVYIVMLAVYIAMLMIISFEMTMISIVVLFIASLIPQGWMRKSIEVGENVVDSNTKLSAYLVSRLKFPNLVRLSGTGEIERSNFNILNENQRRHNVESSILQTKTEVSVDPIVVILSLLMLYLSVTQLNMSIELIGLYLLIVMRILPVIKSVLLQWQGINSVLGSVNIIKKLISEMTANIEKDTGNIDFSKLQNNIIFENVYYSYPSTASYAIKDISFTIPANRMTAIVGSSGSGKSTILDLLLRLRKPKKGKIFLDKVNCNKFLLKSYRDHIAYVPQSPQIFEGSIIDHICYGINNCNDNDIDLVCNMVGIGKFINSLPDRYRTKLGEDAVRLSGGQRQRIELARALISKKPILILDEPTSDLDNKAENDFKLTLRKINEKFNTTIVVISHSLKSISWADSIIVVADGKISASGTHKELLGTCGWYSESWKTEVE